MTDTWENAHHTHRESTWILGNIPCEVKGHKATIHIQVNENAKVTWVGYKEKGHCRSWALLVEALCHNFHKIMATCRMKDLPEPCLSQTKAYKFEHVRQMDAKMRDCI